MADDFSGEVDEIIEDTLTGADDGSLDAGVSEPRGPEKDSVGDSEASDDDAGEDSTLSTRDARTRRDELWEELNMPPEPENVVSHVCETIGLSESVQDEALDLLEKAEDADVPIHRTRVVWTLSAIRLASEIDGESVEWREITTFTDINKQGIEKRTEDLRELS